MKPQFNFKNDVKFDQLSNLSIFQKTKNYKITSPPKKEEEEELYSIPLKSLPLQFQELVAIGFLN